MEFALAIGYATIAAAFIGVLAMAIDIWRKK
jgi:hypothetical protein